MYADFMTTFEKLEDDEAGRLIKHLLRYVNDKNPEPPDRLTEIVFETIKQQLKRDLSKWEGTKESKSTGGQIGNLKRWHVDLYDKVTAGELSPVEALDIAKGRTRSHTDKKLSHPIASVAVNVNGNVTVNDNVKKISTNPVVESFDWVVLLSLINKTFDREFQLINDDTRRKYKARLKDGWTKDHIRSAILAVKEDKHHKENNYKHVTPEYFSRDKTLQLHATGAKAASDTQPTAVMPKLNFKKNQ